MIGGGVFYWVTQVAKSIFFNNTGTDIQASNVEDAIKELNDNAAVSASPGFTWGKNGGVSTNTWLTNNEVSSNRTGRTTALLQNPKIVTIFSGSSSLDTYDLSIYEHEGNEINLTLLITVSVSLSRSGVFEVDVPVTSGRQLATRVTSGSAQNLVVGVVLNGATS